jgi:hypothetical protein
MNNNQMKSEIDKQIEALKDKYPLSSVISQPNGSHFVTVPDFELPDSYNEPKTNLYFDVPAIFPYSCPFGFYFDEHIRLKIANMPAGAWFKESPDASVKSKLMFVRFRLEKWHPNRDNLLSYVRTIKFHLPALEKLSVFGS